MIINVWTKAITIYDKNMNKLITYIKILIVSLICYAYPISIAKAATCFFQYSETSGMNRICYYNCMGSSAAITIGAAQICPLSIVR